MDNEDVEGIGGLGDVQKTLKEVEDHLLESKIRQRRLRWWGHGLTVAIIFVFAVYLGLYYRTLSRNLSRDKFSESLQTHMAEMAPDVANSTVEVLAKVAPLYLDLSKKKAYDLMPEIMRKTRRHSDIFITNTVKFTKDELMARLEKILKRESEEFRKVYQDLTDEQIQTFIIETEKDIHTVFIQLSENLMDLSLPEIMKTELLPESLSREPNDTKNLALYTLFLHKILLLLDHEMAEVEKS